MKLKKFDVVAAVKDAARIHIGPVPPTRLLPHKHRRAPKHRETTRRLLERD
jgi:hypothetical protein